MRMLLKNTFLLTSLLTTTHPLFASDHDSSDFDAIVAMANQKFEEHRAERQAQDRERRIKEFKFQRSIPNVEALIKADDTESLARALGDPRVDVNAPLFTYGDTFTTPLIYSLYHGKHNAAKVLLNFERTDLNKPDSTGSTAIMTAVQENMREQVECLLEKEVNLQSTDENGDNVLIIAAQYASLELLELLLANDTIKAQINNQNELGQTPLMMAAARSADDESLLPILKLLLNAGAKVSIEDNAGDKVFRYLKSINDDVYTILETAQNQAEEQAIPGGCCIIS